MLYTKVALSYEQQVVLLRVGGCKLPTSGAPLAGANWLLPPERLFHPVQGPREG